MKPSQDPACCAVREAGAKLPCQESCSKTSACIAGMRLLHALQDAAEAAVVHQAMLQLSHKHVSGQNITERRAPTPCPQSHPVTCLAGLLSPDKPKQICMCRGMLMDLLRELCGDDGRAGGACLRQMPVPSSLVGATYGALWTRLALGRRLIPLGLFRCGSVVVGKSMIRSCLLHL